MPLERKPEGHRSVHFRTGASSEAGSGAAVCTGASALNRRTELVQHAPENGELRSPRLLGLAVLAFVLRADELSVNQDMVAFVERLHDGLAEAVGGLPDATRLSRPIRLLRFSRSVAWRQKER